MAILIGLKLIAFAMFAKVFAISEGLLPEDSRLANIFQVVTLEVGIPGTGVGYRKDVSLGAAYSLPQAHEAATPELGDQPMPAHGSRSRGSSSESSPPAESSAKPTDLDTS